MSSTNEQQHTPEPWSIDEEMAEPCKMRFYVISGADGDAAALTMYDGEADGEADARRIVAAINFCAGRSTEWLEPGGDGMTIYEGLDTIATDRVLLEAERDALQARLDALIVAAEKAHATLKGLKHKAGNRATTKHELVITADVGLAHLDPAIQAAKAEEE